MKITYKSVTGKTHKIEVDETWGAVILELDRQEHNLIRKETRRHLHLDAYNNIDTEIVFNPHLSLHAFEYRNHLGIDGRDILTELEQELFRYHVRKMVEKLKPSYRDLITAIYFDGVSVDDYAEKEGVSSSAISHRLQTAYKHLKKIL